ncbi:hypothetical protein [Halomontanus rarus]|uniref:hypothetical protein n=1 Tax=Halomontanus rarus TaxID=3034020 RepID=UPI0023E87E0C|nr:hypothetical protein [Halovivax sp. TS33]
MLTLTNSPFTVTVSLDDEPTVRLEDTETGFELADGPYHYEVARREDGRMITEDRLRNASVERLNERTIEITGNLGVAVTHHIELTETGLEETLAFENRTDGPISIEDVACGLTRTLTSAVGEIDGELVDDRFIAIPFRHRPDAPTDEDQEYTAADLLEGSGQDHRVGNPGALRVGEVPSGRWGSEAWAWDRDDRVYLVGTVNDEFVEQSVLEPVLVADQTRLRLAGAGLTGGDLGRKIDLEPGDELSFGTTRIECRQGDFQEAYYAYRNWLDERGCRFPSDYDPSVHWNELYNNPEWNLSTRGGNLNAPEQKGQFASVDTRQVTYTRDLIEEEAATAAAYDCESLYLDPGWDTAFGTFLWGEDRLGEPAEFVREMATEYDLGVSLHCPLAPWMSLDGRGVDEWPAESYREDEDGNTIPEVCLGSEDYLEAAADRLRTLCDAGVSFLMYDGTFWTGSCWNEDHDHADPYTKEDQCDAAVDLVQRVHETHPDVLIEMHDMVSGGSRHRFTPVYYRYADPDSYDENWGFELMWSPMEDLRSGRARSLYYYNLACNVPLYLHIDLRDDNEHCLAFWWYASTCRHLGIGGTHRNPQIAAANREAMKTYRSYEEYFKRGEFYGTKDCREEAHFHVLPEDDSFVLTLFNLEAEERVLSGSVPIADLGIDGDEHAFIAQGSHLTISDDEIHWRRRLPAHSADVIPVETIHIEEFKRDGPAESA